MRTQFATALLALAAPLHAIKVTSPSKNDVVDPSEGVEVKWSTVNTDPSRAKLVLVNMASGHAPFNKDLGEIDLSAGSIVISEKDVPSDGGYQFNFESLDKLNTGILAQSEQFEVKDDGNDSDDDKKSTTTTSTSKSTSTSATTTSSVVKTATFTSTATFSDSTVTMTATTLTTAAASTSGTTTKGSDDGDDAGELTTSASTGAAAPTGMAVQAGSLFALVAGVAAVMA